jgi:hypothetical protein
VNNHQHQFEVEAKATVKGFGFKEKNAIEITVPDSIGSNLSVSVTDAGLYSDSSTNIYTDFLLSGDIKGYINNPAYYFQENDSAAQNLDLVMLTHGWRRFKWDDVVRGKMPNLAYQKDSDYLEIKGKVYGASKKIQKGQMMNMFLQTKDSSTQFLPMIGVSTEGDFLIKGVVFYDTIKVYYQFNGNKALTNRTDLKLQNGLLPPPFTKMPPFAASSSHVWANLADSNLLRNRYFNLQQAEIAQKYKATMLANVTVRGRAKTPTQILDEKYTSGLFSGGDSHNFDLTNDPFALSAQNVFMYLQGKVAGLQINYGGSGGVSMTWRGAQPALFLDENHAYVDQLQNMPMSDVAYIKVFNPPFFGAFGGGGGGAIAVYTRKGGDVLPGAGNGMGYTTLAGYTTYKEFFSPNYAVDDNKPDVRTTLYWNPFVLTDKKNRTVKLQFFNNDVSKKFRVVVEGVNKNGQLARVEKVIE